MIRDLVSSLDYSLCAEAALGLFVASFLIVTYATSRLSRQATSRFSAIPLDDTLQDPTHVD